jgi:hypothetical protein
LLVSSSLSPCHAAALNIAQTNLFLFKRTTVVHHRLAAQHRRAFPPRR